MRTELGLAALGHPQEQGLLHVSTRRYDGPEYGSPCTVYTLLCDERQYVVRVLDQAPDEAVFMHGLVLNGTNWDWFLPEDIPYGEPVFQKAVSEIRARGLRRILYFIDGFHPVDDRRFLAA